MPKFTQEERDAHADRVVAALAAYNKARGQRSDTVETDLQDLITDIHHYARSQGLARNKPAIMKRLDSMMDMAHMHFEEE